MKKTEKISVLEKDRICTLEKERIGTPIKAGKIHAMTKAGKIYTDDDLVPLREVPSLLPTPVDIVTLWHWRTKGIRGVRLPSVHIGGRVFISKRALEHFIKQLSADETEATPGESPAQHDRRRKRQVEHARERLAADGI